MTQPTVDTRDGRPRCAPQIYLPPSNLTKAIAGTQRDWIIVAARRPPIGEIVADAARRHGLTAAKIMVKSRTRRLVDARAEAMLICSMAGYSRRRIAGFFDLDRSTVLNAIRKASLARKLEAA